MKTYLFLLAALLTFCTTTVMADSEDKNLGRFNLRFTYQAWEPKLNTLPIGDITHDIVYADFAFTPVNDLAFIIRRGNGYAFGCKQEDVAEKYFLIELDSEGKEISVVDVTDARAEAKAERSYVIRAYAANLKICQGYGTSFMALLK